MKFAKMAAVAAALCVTLVAPASYASDAMARAGYPNILCRERRDARFFVGQEPLVRRAGTLT